MLVKKSSSTVFTFTDTMNASVPVCFGKAAATKLGFFRFKPILFFLNNKFENNTKYEGGNCAYYYKSGWWFSRCFAANLNGKYYHGSYSHETIRDGIYWGRWPHLKGSV